MRVVGTRACCFLTAVTAIALADPARAIYLDADRDFAVRARIYSQASIRLEDSRIDTVPDTRAGQLVQHRNFYNPEADAKLTKYTRWMRGAGLSWLEPDDLSFRIAAWGFYDGVYDYGSSQFDEARRPINRGYPNPSGQRAFFLRGERFRCPNRIGDGICVDDGDLPFADLERVFPKHTVQRPRDIFASQERINELYLSYSKGPIFLRVGRQAISWGEADTIALLDQNNPFDVTAGAPGAFLDLEEARIPLWTLRGSVRLFDSLGPLASGSLEAYWVPGTIDTNTGYIPPLASGPYSPRGQDPQTTIASIVPPGALVNHQFVLFDHKPEKKLSNSRYGVRFQTVIAHHHSFSAWFYTHFPNQPAARSLGSVRMAAQDATTKRFLFVTETFRKLTSVYGVANSFYFAPIDSIIRAEVEYFENEPGFIPSTSLGASNDPNQNPGLDLLSHVGQVPYQDMMRWEFGVDRFFFIRALNSANAFLISTSVVGHWNLSETGNRDYYAVGQRRPGQLGNFATDFVDLEKVEAFLNTHLENQWWHGKIFAAFTGIAHSRGTWAAMPEMRYRFNDSLHFSAKAILIGGTFQGIGLFKDRDQISFRTTFLLN